MYSFITAFDDHIKNKVIYDYNTIEGNLRFVKNKSIIIIDVIFLHECFRRRGILKKFLHHVVNSVKIFKFKFMIQSVLSKILYEYLLRFNYDGHTFKLCKDGFLLTN